MLLDESHIQQVLAEIEVNFSKYFKRYLETEAGNKITEDIFNQISDELGCTNVKITKGKIDKVKIFKNIIKESINSFEKDRENYLDILNQDSLEEYEDDPFNFKNSVLKNKCPIIRLTLQNKKAKELDKYRAEFRRSNPNELIKVVSNLTDFANEYLDEIYDEEEYEKITTLDGLGLSPLDGEDYIVYGVIGGGIKSHLLYKFSPSVFSNRSREALWAFWYLTGKQAFGCVEDSEFIIIKLHENTTQQNFFYPYELFSLCESMGNEFPTIL